MCACLFVWGRVDVPENKQNRTANHRVLNMAKTVWACAREEVRGEGGGEGQEEEREEEVEEEERGR